MDGMKRSMKYSLIFGICGSVAISLVYELYANVSRDFALLLFACGTVFAGAKFSSLKAREAMLGMTATVAYSVGLGFPVYLVIHPAVKKMLEKRSVYFQLELSQQLAFVVKILLIMLLMFGVWCARAGFRKAVEKFRSNSEKTGDYIDNAFDDDKEQK